MLSDSLYIKFQNRYSDSLGLEVRMVRREEGGVRRLDSSLWGLWMLGSCVF